MIAATLMTLAIVTQDQASLRAAPRDSAAQQAALWQGDTLEIRGQRMDYWQVYDHRRERAGYIHVSQVRPLSMKPEDAPALLTVLRFLRDSPGAESLGMGYTAAYLKAAPAGTIGAEAFDALGTMAERLARRAGMKHPKAVSDTISAHMEVASFYGVNFKAYEREGSLQLCYEGEAFRRVLALPSDAEQRAGAALALTRHECMASDLHPQARLALDQNRAHLLDQISPAQWAQLTSVTKNRLHLRRAGVQASLAFQLARRGASPVVAAQQALDALAGVDKAELTDADVQEYTDTAIRVGASRWAADTSPAPAAPLTLVTEVGQPGETCLVVLDKRATAKAAPQSDTKPMPLIKRCTYGVVWAASASVHPNGQALTVAVQPLDTWRELWVIRQIAGQWTVDVLPPSSSNPELGYVEFAGWTPATSTQGPHMLLARETRVAGRSKRSFEVLRLDTLTAEKQASDPSLLLAFGRGQDARWKRQTVSLR
jgi:hypothetical protein